jgi:hypothetical protein
MADRTDRDRRSVTLRDEEKSCYIMEETMHVLLAVDGSEEAQDAARSLSSLAPLQSVTVLYDVSDDCPGD